MFNVQLLEGGGGNKLYLYYKSDCDCYIILCCMY